MATVVKKKLSGSTDGRGIKVVATATPGTTIHTAVAGTTVGTFDEVWLYVTNSSSGAVNITIQWGGTTAPDDSILVTLPALGADFRLLIPGLVLQNGSVIRAFANVANVVMVHGYVHAITA